MSGIGILDPSGNNKNPLNGEDYSDKYKELGKIWSTFPAYKRANEIIETIKKNQVTIITSGTGSGKTVLVPKYLLHVLNYTGKVAVTLPKQIIVKSTADFAALTLDVKMGEQIGYQYKGSDRKNISEQSRLIYITDGSLVARIMNDVTLPGIDGVIIDEAHERNVRIDFLLYLTKDVLRKRPDFKLIVMSATIDTSLFGKYFSEFKSTILNITGESLHPIKSIYLEHSISERDYIKYGMAVMNKIITTTDDGDILFFVTSINETMDACKMLKNDKDSLCLEVYSGIPSDKQTLVENVSKYKEGTSYKRKVVVATNAAESSLTIDGIMYVIESGYELSSNYDPDMKAKRLDRQRITQAQAKQRMGRAGRTAPGTCYHLYTEEDFKKMDPFPTPEIRTSDITSECLRLLGTEYINNTDKLKNTFKNFIEPPKSEYVNSAINKLRELGLIKDNKISKLGEMVNNVNTTLPELGVALIYGYMLGCVFEVSKIISIMETLRFNISDLFITPLDKVQDTDPDNRKKAMMRLMDKFNNKKKSLASSTGDHISLLKIYSKYRKLKENSLNDFLFENFLKLKKLQKIKKSNFRLKGIIMKHIIKNEYLDSHLEKFKDIRQNTGEKDRILMAFYMGFRSLGKLIQGTGKYRTDVDNDQQFGIARDSFLNLMGKEPKTILYTELFITMGTGSLNIVSTLSDKHIKEIRDLKID